MVSATPGPAPRSAAGSIPGPDRAICCPDAKNAMRVVVALGGNALLRRGQPMTAANQRENVKLACDRLAPAQ